LQYFESASVKPLLFEKRGQGQRKINYESLAVAMISVKRLKKNLRFDRKNEQSLALRCL
jgi:hypothetical protein